MRKLSKGIEPTNFTRWKAKHPNSNYNDLSHIERQEISLACLKEQFYLCAYCCQGITDKNNMNEHVEARNIAPNRSLDFSNIVASCNTSKQCDSAHGSQSLPLTPLMAECETELKFMISGRVKGLTPRAKESIRVLNLGDKEQNNRSLIEKRKKLSHELLFINGIDPSAGLDDEQLINMVITDINQPKAGKLEAFSPVVANILRNWLVA